MTFDPELLKPSHGLDCECTPEIMTAADRNPSSDDIIVLSTSASEG